MILRGLEAPVLPAELRLYSWTIPLKVALPDLYTGTWYLVLALDYHRPFHNSL